MLGQHAFREVDTLFDVGQSMVDPLLESAELVADLMHGRRDLVFAGGTHPHFVLDYADDRLDDGQPQDNPRDHPSDWDDEIVDEYWV